MIALRLAGAVFLTVSGAMSAYLINAAASASLSQTEGFIAFVRFARVQVDCFSLPIGEILSSFEEKELLECGYDQKTKPKNLLEMSCSLRVYDSEAYKIFCTFASEFGRGYRTEQLRACDYYISLLEERRKTLLSSLPAKKKRNGAVCVCASLALAILLL